MRTKKLLERLSVRLRSMVTRQRVRELALRVLLEKTFSLGTHSCKHELHLPKQYLQMRLRDATSRLTDNGWSSAASSAPTRFLSRSLTHTIMSMEFYEFFEHLRNKRFMIDGCKKLSVIFFLFFILRNSRCFKTCIIFQR